MNAMTRAADTARRSPAWLILLVVCLAQFMVVLDSTDRERRAADAAGRPRLLARARCQWVLNAYTLMFGGFLLLGGRAADLFGRRNLFVAGVVALHRRVAARRPRNVARARSSSLAALQGLGAALVSRPPRCRS